jgi:hypothetical protein
MTTFRRQTERNAFANAAARASDNGDFLFQD